MALLRRLRHEPFKLRTTDKTAVQISPKRRTYSQANEKDANDNFTKVDEQLTIDNMLDKFKSKIGISKRVDDNSTSSNNNSKQQNANSCLNSDKKNFHLGDIIGFVNKGIGSIIDDDVTKRFTTEG